MSETTSQTFSDEAVPPKEPDAALSLEERTEQVLGYKPKTLETRRKIEEKEAREKARATGLANLPLVKDSLESLVTIYGPSIGVQTPQQMDTYLRKEASKEGLLRNSVLYTSEASNFFSNVARAEFAYEPTSKSPLVSLEAYQKGFKRNQEEQADAAELLQQAYQTGAEPTVVYTTSYGGNAIPIPRWDKEDENQKQVLDQLNTNLAGGALGNLTGVSFTPQQIALQQRSHNVSPASLKAMGFEADASSLKEAKDLITNSDVSFEGRKFRPDHVFVHLMDVSSQGKAGSKNAINMHKHLREWEIAYNDLAAHEAGFPDFASWAVSEELSDAKRKEVLTKSYQKALADIKRVQQQSRPGTIFIDDPDKLVRSVREGKDPLAYTSIPVNVASGLKDLGLISEGTYDAFLRQRGPWAAIWYPPSMRQFNMGTLTYADQVEDINPGTFQQIMNIGPLRVLGSWLLSDESELVYGSKDHLRGLLKFDWGANLGKVGEKAVELTGTKGTGLEKAVRLWGTVQGTGAMFIEPDIITLAMLPVGAVGKGAKLGAKAAAKTATGAETLAGAAAIYRLRQYDTLLKQVQTKIADQSFTESKQVVNFFKENNAPELASMYDLQLMSDVAGSIKIGTKGRRDYSSSFDNITNKLQETRDEIQELVGNVADDVPRYIDRYGKTPLNATPDEIKLARAKQEEAVFEAAQAYASFILEREKLSHVAGQRGVPLSRLAQREVDPNSPDFWDEPLINTIEESRSAYDDMKELEKIYGQEVKWKLSLEAILANGKKLTKNQQEDLARLTKSIPVLKKEHREAQELVRQRWAKGALDAQYQKYRVAKSAFEEKVLSKSHLFDDLPDQVVQGVKVNPSRRLREAFSAREKLRNAKKHTDTKRKGANASAQSALFEKSRKQTKQLRDLNKNFDMALKSYLKATETGVPSLGSIGQNLHQKLSKELVETVSAQKPLYMQRALTALEETVGAYEGMLQTRKLQDSSPLIYESRFVSLDPKDPTKARLDLNSYLTELKKKYTDDAGTLDPLITDFIDNSQLHQRLVDTAGEVTGRELKQLADFENTVTARAISEQESLTSVAQGLIRTWSQPSSLREVFKQIDILDPKTWLDRAALTNMALRTGFSTTKTIAKYFDPKVHRFGDYSERALTQAQLAMTRQSRANEELTLLSDQWVRQGENYVDNVNEYLTTDKAFFLHFRGQRAPTDEGLGVGLPAVMNQGEHTPWKQFKRYILGLEDPQDSLAFKAVAFAYLGRGVEAGEQFNKWSKNTLGSLLRTLKKLDDESDLLSDSEQLSRFVAAIKKETQSVGVDPDAKRTFAFVAKGILHGAVMDTFLTDLVRSGGIAMTTKQALSANTILGQVKTVIKHDPELGKDIAEVVSLAPGARTGFDPAEGFKALEQWGIAMDDPRFNTVLRGINRMEALNKQLISVNTLGDASKVSFIPQSFLTQIEEVAGKISRDLAQTTVPDGPLRKALSALSTYLRVWRGNILFGTVTPRATYFTNQFMGDLSQLHTFEGAVSIRQIQLGKHKGKVYVTGSAPLMFQNAFTYIPYWGNWTQDYLIQRTKDATRAGRRNVLTTPLQAALNPYITDLMRMSDELVETKEGFRSGRQFMEEALEDGVFDTLMTDDLYKMLDDAAKQNQGSISQKVDQVITGVDNFKSNWTNMVTTTQARQRLALYAEYRLMRGEARSASKQAVFDSLYDWRHGVTDWEMATLGQVIAFYPFFRLGAKQFQRAILEGLTNPSVDVAKRALVGQSKLARIRNQGRAVYSVANYVWNEDVDQALNEEQMQHEIYRRMRPWWTGSRPAPSNNLMPMNDQLEFRKAGRTETYYTTTYPMWTSLDMADLHLKLFNGVVGAMMYYGNNGQIRPTYDAAQVVNKTVADFSHPIFKVGVEAATDLAFGASPSFESKKGKRLRLGEVGAYQAYSKLPFLSSMIDVTPDQKGYYVPSSTAAIIRGIPIIGTDIPNMWRDLGPVSMGGGNPKWATQSTAAMAFFLRNWTSIGKQIPFAPGQAEDYDRKQRKADVIAHGKKLRAQAESGGSPEVARQREIDAAKKK